MALRALSTDPVPYRQIPCEPGTYNDLEQRTKGADCVACPKEKACERKAEIDAVTLPDCEAGYWCQSGAKSRYPDGVGTSSSGPCPAGSYCPKASELPTPCPTGTFNP